MNVEQIAAEIAKNNMGEEEAIEGYYKLLDTLKSSHAPVELVRRVEEIISDELNHAQHLSAWITRLTGIQPAKD